MKRILVFIAALFVVASCLGQYQTIYRVPNKTTGFGIVLPAGTLVHEVDSAKIYQLSRKVTAVQTMAYVFSNNYYTVVAGGVNSPLSQSDVTGLTARLDSIHNVSLWVQDDGYLRPKTDSLICIGTTDPTITNARFVLTGTRVPSNNGHGYVNEETCNPTVINKAYAGFDAAFTMSGTLNYDHLCNYQARANYTGAGVLGTYYGFGEWANITDSVTVHYGLYLDKPTGGGKISRNYGLYIPDMRGSGYDYWYGIYSAANNNKFLGYNYFDSIYVAHWGYAKQFYVNEDLHTVDFYGTGVTSMSTFYNRGSFYVRNKADGAWLNFASRNTAGNEVVYNLDYIGSVKLPDVTNKQLNTRETITANLVWGSEDSLIRSDEYYRRVAWSLDTIQDLNNKHVLIPAPGAGKYIAVHKIDSYIIPNAGGAWEVGSQYLILDYNRQGSITNYLYLSNGNLETASTILVTALGYGTTTCFEMYHPQINQPVTGLLSGTTAPGNANTPTIVFYIWYSIVSL